MRIQKRILVVFGIALITTTFFFYVGYRNHKRIVENSSQINQTQDILKNIDSAFYSIFDLESNVKSLVITGIPVFEQESLSGITGLKRIQNEFDGLKKISNGKNLDLSVISQQINRKVNWEYSVIQANKISQHQALQMMAGLKDKLFTDSLKQSLSGLEKIYANQLSTMVAENKTISKSNLSSSVIIGLLALIFISIILMQVNRYMRLKKAAEKEANLKEIKYSRFVEDSGLVLVITDLKGNISFINNRVKDFTGFKPAEIIGRHFSLLVDDAWVPVINNNFKKQVQTKEFEIQFEYPLKVKSGNQTWVEQSSIILYENNKPTGFQCIVKNITERKNAESEAKKSELEREENQYRLQSILDNAALIVYIKDLEGRYTLINKPYKSLYQFTDEQAIGKTDFDLLPESEAQRNYDIEQYVIRKQETIEMEETISRSGSAHNLLMVRFPLFDKNQKIYGIGGIATDITERFLYGKHLIEERSKAEMAEQLQEQFLANMSHEIRTPMNGIIGMTNILIDTALSGEQKEFVQVIKKSSDNLLVLINDILDISKIKAGKLRIEKIDFQLRETVENTLVPFNVRVMEKGLKLGFVVDRSIPDLLVGDPHRLNQILTNLLSNAIKFTEKGEINLEIKMLNYQTDAVALEFSVSDTGIGVAEDKLQYIFESFTQAETGITRKFGGTGLGLSITKKLIELQHGTIDVTSKTGKGTTFTFVLNYAISKNEGISKKQKDAELETINGNNLAGKRVLVIEDNETNRKVIFHMLKKVGIESKMAGNGKEAIKVLESENKFDLIIMDLQMPEMDGFETTKFIRKKLNLTTPIIAMTASALRNEKVKCFELGMNEYLTKPFVPAELYRQLRRFLLSGNTSVNGIQDKTPGDTKGIDKPYNLDHLVELDDMDCLCEILQLFLESTPISLNEISSAIDENNWEKVYQQTHKLKSSLGLLQMDELLPVITRIELNAKECKNLESIPDDFIKAKTLFEEIKPMIETELKEAVELLVKN